MNYDFPLWKPSRHYVYPAEEGPAWREAYEAGFDMAELEENLKLTPEERLEKHSRVRDDFLKREEFFTLMQYGRDFISSVESQLTNRKSKI